MSRSQNLEAGGQTNTAEIGGVVRDVSGGVLPGAGVTARHAASGVSVVRVTDGEGRFFLPALRIGQWEIVVTLHGFAPQRRTVAVEIGRTVALDFTLTIEGLAEQITVDVPVPMLQTTTAEISDVIENLAVVQLPLNGRNFLALAQLSDSVVLPPGGTRGEALQQAGPLPNVGGQRSGHNIYLLDGAKVTDELFNNLVINPSIDSIEEFKIQKSMYPAEFGGKASALINVSTKAGANQFHGSGFEFHRNHAFDATNFFHPAGQPKPPLRQNQFGGALGGPIVRSRTFFFGSYEGTRLRRSVTRTFTVPSATLRAGDFSSAAPICDPSPVASIGSCAPFANNQIPSSRIDPIASAFFQQVPLPTATTASQNLTAIEETTRDLNQFSVRFDHRLTQNDSLLARFSTFDAGELQPYGTGVLQESLVPGFGRQLTTHTRNLVAGHTRVFGDSVLNELRFGWMGVSGGQLSVNRGTNFAAQVGLLGVTTDPRDVGYPQISTAGLFSTMGDPTVFTTRNNHQVELYENLTVDRGAHRFKLGGYFFPTALASRTARQCPRQFRVHRTVHGQCVRRLSAWLSDLSHLGDRPRRRRWPHALAASVRAG